MPTPDNTASEELRLRELFQQAPVSLQIFGPDGRTLRVNKAWESLWQIHEGSELKKFVFSEAFNLLTDPQLIANGIVAYLRRALAGESVEIPAIQYDVGLLGGVAKRWVTARAHPIKDGSGAVLEVMLMHEDITSRIDAENALREREERFRSLVMATSQIVWTSTPDGRVLEDSPSWRAFTGGTYEEGKEYGWLNALHPEDREPTRVLWTACLASRSVFETEYRLRCADGSYRWTAVKGVPIVDGGGARPWHAKSATPPCWPRSPRRRARCTRSCPARISPRPWSPKCARSSACATRTCSWPRAMTGRGSSIRCGHRTGLPCR
jgi:PAS domain S-box-containing protein